jgi:Cu+-exporting ATPase
MVGVGKGAEAGILIRSAEYLERSQKVNTVVLDKTGTITKGEPSVTDIMTFNGYTSHDVLGISASAESGSEHPLAHAIVSMAKSKKLVLENLREFEAVSGMGVKALVGDKKVFFGNRKLLQKFKIQSEMIEQKMTKLESEGKTVMILAESSVVAGMIAVADTIKESSPAAVRELTELGIETIMLTGDNEKTANAVAKKVGIKNIIASVLPGDKANVIKNLQSKGKVVAMVGDGINDAPALAQADIGIAIGSGSDIAKETGGIILIKDDIMDVARAIRLSRATMNKIKQNLFWALIYNSGGIPIAAIGLLSPMVAAAAMALSSISVIANSSLLKRLKIKDTQIRNSERQQNNEQTMKPRVTVDTSV